MALPQPVEIPGFHPPSSYFSHCVRYGDTLYLAGQGAMGDDGRLVGPGDIGAQAEQTFTNIQRVLEGAGANLRHVIRMTTFLTDPRHHSVVMETRRKFFGDYAPASTLCCVNSLPQDGMLIAVEVIAAAPAQES